MAGSNSDEEVLNEDDQLYYEDEFIEESSNVQSSHIPKTFRVTLKNKNLIQSLTKRSSPITSSKYISSTVHSRRGADSHGASGPCSLPCIYTSDPNKLPLNNSIYPSSLSTKLRRRNWVQEGRPVRKNVLNYLDFPKYRRQYKIESIYVNDLYTLTYDNEESLEGIGAVEVTYRRTDRETIRQKLAMGTDDESEKFFNKPNLQSRLQSGMNLQICFMNETVSDCECSDTESAQDTYCDIEDEHKKLWNAGSGSSEDFLNRQSQLQTEARLALAQAKEMAKMQMEMERMAKVTSPIADMVRKSFLKVGFPLASDKRRMSRQILTDMNVAQLQVIVNDIHTQIEILNEELVQGLLERDDLHMEQDSKLVDIEDLSKHLSAKHCDTPVDVISPGSESTKSSTKSTKEIQPSSKVRIRQGDK